MGRKQNRRKAAERARRARRAEAKRAAAWRVPPWFWKWIAGPAVAGAANAAGRLLVERVAAG